MKETPAEWDGPTFGGGKLSQRYWEYLKTIDYLDLTSDSVVLDIGGGSSLSQYPFFSMLIQPFVKEVILVDPGMEFSEILTDKMVLYPENADYDSLKNIFFKHDITHLACISVFEHVIPEIRNGIILGINDFFKGNRFVTTFEYHPRKRWFESQLTAKTLSDMVLNFTNFYLDDYVSSPVRSENAFKVFHRKANPRWYPLALKFNRI